VGKVVPTLFDARPWLGPEREALAQLLEGLDDAEWKASTECPAWDVFGVALHVLGDDLSLLARQRDAAQNSLFLFAQDHPGLSFPALLDGFNEQWVTAARFFGPAITIELLRITGAWTEEFYGNVDLDQRGELVLLFNEPNGAPYWQIIAREYVERWTHQQQIRRALGKEPLTEPFVRPAIDVIMRALQASLPDLGATPGQRIVLAVEGLDTWSIERTSDGWTLLSDTAPAAHDAVTITLDVVTAAALFSRGLTPAEVPAVLRPTGEAKLASALTTWVQPLLGRP
jgi:uncharacterized protein (TIGR03083 family)